MLRVSPQELRTYMNLESNDDTDLSIFLEMGNTLVEDELTGKGLSDGRLKMIELNLDAHFCCLAVEKGGIVRSTAGSSSEDYQMERPTKPNLSRTRYGQQAVTLDSTGILSTMDISVGVAEFRVL